MNQVTVLASLIFILLSNIANAQFISNQNGNWDDGRTWGNPSPGVAGIDYPNQTQDAIIQNGHLVVINADNDNGGPAVSPEGLGLPNVGDGVLNGSASFPSAETIMFYHIGNITIQQGATLRITRRCIFAGTTVIQGTLSTTGDVVNLGTLNATSTSVLDIGDDYIMSGNSVTDIDGPILAADDLYIDNIDAVIGGSGSLGIGDDLQTFNPRNHDPSNQICSQFVIGCGDDCNPSVGGAQAAIVGTSTHPICLELYPVEFENVEAEAINLNTVIVRWSTATETNNDFFEVERLVGEGEWILVGMTYGAGTTVEAQSYELEDANAVQGYNYYRVKQVDFDGSFTYSNTVAVELKSSVNTIDIAIAPNPVMANQPITILNVSSLDQIEVYNQYGVLIKVIQQPNATVSLDLTAGVYNLRIQSEGEFTTRRVVVL